MKINILTIFPDMFDSMFNTSILGRAQEKGIISIKATDIRPYSNSKHKNTDDYPFGGGAGMLMMAQPIADAIKDIRAQNECTGKVIYMSPRGTTLTQSLAQELAQEEDLRFFAVTTKALINAYLISMWIWKFQSEITF